MPGRGDQPRTEPFGVVDGPERARDLHLAAIAGAGVDMADLQRTLHPAGGFIAGPGAGGAGSTTRPTRRILPIQPMPLPDIPPGRGVLKHGDPVTEHPGQNLSRHREEFGDIR